MLQKHNPLSGHRRRFKPPARLGIAHDVADPVIARELMPAMAALSALVALK
jgi:hypothetical protein